MSGAGSVQVQERYISKWPQRARRLGRGLTYPGFVEVTGAGLAYSVMNNMNPFLSSLSNIAWVEETDVDGFNLVH